VNVNVKVNGGRLGDRSQKIGDRGAKSGRREDSRESEREGKFEQILPQRRRDAEGLFVNVNPPAPRI
jgi:hypothetical protein